METDLSQGSDPAQVIPANVDQPAGAAVNDAPMNVVS
jgi:hypothetical protein